MSPIEIGFDGVHTVVPLGWDRMLFGTKFSIAFVRTCLRMANTYLSSFVRIYRIVYVFYTFIISIRTVCANNKWYMCTK